jgi:hypothetical protein
LALWPNHAGIVVAPRTYRRADRGPDPAATLKEIASATCAEADLSRYNGRNDSTPDPGDPGDPNETNEPRGLTTAEARKIADPRTAKPPRFEREGSRERLESAGRRSAKDDNQNS